MKKITKQIKDKTQQDRLLKFLQARGSRGVYVYEIQNSRPEGLGIAQYNARVSELRDMGYDIENVVKGFFVLKEGSTTPLPNEGHLKIEPRGANLASDKKNPSKGRVIAYYDSFGNSGTIEI